MAARRNRRRRRRNRGRFGFLYKLLSALLIFAAILMGCAVFFRVNQILVSGQSKYTAEEIIAASGVKMGDNLFGINKFAVSRQVRTSLPYVDNISFHSRLPDTLVISVTECIPAAVIQGEGAYWLMDASCKLLDRGDASLAQGQALVRGVAPLAPTVGKPLAAGEQDQTKLEQLQGLLSALDAQQMMGSVKSFIDLTAENKIRFSYGEKLTVVVPLFDSDFTKTVNRLRHTLWKMDEDGVARTGTLDLTYQERTFLSPERWLPEDTPPAAPAATPAPSPAPSPEASLPPPSEPQQKEIPQAQGDTQ